MKSGPRDSTKQDLTGSLAGDKVRIKTGSHAGKRGILQVAGDGTLVVNLDSGEVVSALGEELTNFSLAARRAWEVMPKRAGRPPSLRPRMQMVSLRVEIELWQRLREAVQDGLLPSREQAINSWIRQHLDEIEQGSRASSTTVQAASDRDPLRGKQK